ncbi:MAG: hypothetical protein IKP61_03455, partial [Spirochaetales bacterium]|nr:hypothetical protein [Spirochaetales bacterium]
VEIREYYIGQYPPGQYPADSGSGTEDRPIDAYGIQIILQAGSISNDGDCPFDQMGEIIPGMEI